MQGKKPTPITERLWPRVDTTGDCWLWTGATNPQGYGLIGTGRRQKVMLVHRLTWMLLRGDPGTMNVLHRCDTPLCCNPEHLFLGTQAENMRDMDTKRRCVRIGERRRRLTPEQEKEVLASTESSYELAERFPLSARSIRHLRKRGGYRYTDKPWQKGI